MGRGKFGTVYHVVGRKDGISYASKHVKYRWVHKGRVSMSSTGKLQCTACQLHVKTKTLWSIRIPDTHTYSLGLLSFISWFPDLSWSFWLQSLQLSDICSLCSQLINLIPKTNIVLLPDMCPLSPTNQSQELGGETKDCCRSRPHEEVSLHHHLLIITIINKLQGKPPNNNHVSHNFYDD